MPLGDSITHGGVVPGGYRAKLFENLTNAECNFIFVGSATNNPTPLMTTAGQIHHEGHCGYRLDQLSGNLDANNGESDNDGGHWLSGTSGRSAIRPDVVLLEAGINDIGQGASAATAYSRLDALVGHILSDRPDAAVIVASLVPHASSTLESVVLQYNAMIPNLVSKYSSAGSDVYCLDMHSVVSVADLSDGVHPNQTGYNAMGNAWFSAMQVHGLVTPEPSASILSLIGGVLLLGHAGRRRKCV